MQRLGKSEKVNIISDEDGKNIVLINDIWNIREVSYLFDKNVSKM